MIGEDATAQAAAVRRGEVSPLELVDAAIARVQDLNPRLNAVIHEQFDAARAEAAGHLPDGPFRGVPFLVKDLTCHRGGDPLHEGMAFLKRRGWVASGDTHLASRFRAAGLVSLGRTNTPELGILPTTEPAAYGPTRNPWDVSRSPGGSSGGSAAAVAAGLVPLAHANDGGGSIRIPASECGLVGLKPSRARVSLAPEAGDVMGGLVCELAVTRTVRDTATLLDAVHGTVPGDPYEVRPPDRPYADEVRADPGQLRIGIRTRAFGDTATTHAECVAAAEATGRLLEELGHTVVPVDLPEADDPGYVTHFIATWSAGVRWNLDRWSRLTGVEIGEDDVEPLTWALGESGRATTGAQLFTAREMLQTISRRLVQRWDTDFDLLLTPTLAEPPPLLGEFDSPADNPLHGLFRAAEVVPFTPLFNVTGQPAISLPLHHNDDGLPLGIQLVAALGREDLLLRVSAQLEEANPWADRWPPVRS